jgi:hypothetical protein
MELDSEICRISDLQKEKNDNIILDETVTQIGNPWYQKHVIYWLNFFSLINESKTF